MTTKQQSKSYTDLRKRLENSAQMLRDLEILRKERNDQTLGLSIETFVLRREFIELGIEEQQ